MLLFLFRSGLARHGLKQPYQNANRRRSTRALYKACVSMKTRRRENVKFIYIVTNCKDRFINYKLQLLAYVYEKQSPGGVLQKRCS